MSKTYQIYFHRNPTTNEVFYVGFGTARRPMAFGPKARSDWWNNYVKEHGYPVVELRECTLDLEEAGRLEQKYIREFGRMGLDEGGTLVNRSVGGLTTIGFVHSEESKRKMSVGHKGKKLPTRILSETHRLKIGLSRKGKKHSPETLAKINEKAVGQKVIDTKTGKVYNSIKKAAREMDYAATTLNSMLRGMYPNKTTLKILESL